MSGLDKGVSIHDTVVTCLFFTIFTRKQYFWLWFFQVRDLEISLSVFLLKSKVYI